MDSIFLFLVVFSVIISFFAPHFFGAGALEFARYVPAAPSILDIFGGIWNGFVSLLAIMVFTIPGLEIVSVLYDTLVAWVVLRWIRG